MKLKVEHLGRIRAAEIEIRPLTIFVGRNNTNKTWTAYSLFGVLQALRWRNQHLPRDLVLDPALESEVKRIGDALRAKIGGLNEGTRLFETVRRSEIVASLGETARFSLRPSAIRSVIAASVDPRARVELGAEALAVVASSVTAPS